MDLSQTAVDDGFKLLVSLAFVPVLLGVGRRIRMPNGWHRHLVVNAAPFEDSSGRVSGAVAAFIEREPWSPVSSR